MKLYYTFMWICKTLNIKKYLKFTQDKKLSKLKIWFTFSAWINTVWMYGLRDVRLSNIHFSRPVSLDTYPEGRATSLPYLVRTLSYQVNKQLTENTEKKSNVIIWTI